MRRPGTRLNSVGLRRGVCKSSELKEPQVMSLLYLYSYFTDMAMKLCCRVLGSRRGDGCKGPPLDTRPRRDRAQVRMADDCFSSPMQKPSVQAFPSLLEAEGEGGRCFDRTHTFPSLPYFLVIVQRCRAGRLCSWRIRAV